MAAAGELPPCYMQHVVAQERGHRAWPLALYVDGVPTTSKDGMLGFWVYSLLTQKRHLCVALRKSSLCRCGCRGWCTLHGVFAFLHWSFQALAAQQFPPSRHDGRPWLTQKSSSMADDDRASLAGLPLKCSGALIMLKGDWSEYHVTFGFMAPTSVAAPCPACWCTRDDMYQGRCHSGSGLPWRLIQATQTIWRRRRGASIGARCARRKIIGCCLRISLMTAVAPAIKPAPSAWL